MANSKTIQINLKAVADVKDVTTNIKQIQTAMSQLKMPDSLNKNFVKIFADAEKYGNKAAEILATGFKTKGDVSTYTKNVEALCRTFETLVANMGKIDTNILEESFKMDIDPTQLNKINQEITDLQNKLSALRADQLNKVDSALTKAATDAKSSAASWTRFKEAIKTGDLDAAKKALNGLNSGFNNIKRGTESGSQKAQAYKEALDALTEVYTELSTDGSEYNNILAQIEAKNLEKGGLSAERIREAGEQWQYTCDQATKMADGLDQVRTSSTQAAESQQHLNSELDGLKSKITYFFGLSNAVLLFRRALQSAYDTVTDLDKVMTETAVVTDFSVGDMWDQLPEYTQRANELGVSIHSAYEAATIYYQQGLKTNEVMAVSNETLKMARIAGLDAATATDRMTNAMRGFNMAITEANAQKVNDVYSKLAAITASDTDEISTAMTKVASLAHNANMEFETTSAFLAQMIETTRESAETAGTALKTVIARFSEVKKLYSEGELLGTDEEGEEIDVNKVSTALRTAGINLNEYLTGAKGLDDIFIELASKWDSLDIIQQRYIATMAAGSRQQSRFIAMMSDYKRTVELVDAANNSAGASNEQYQKTLDSLETKLNKLKNAWDEFVMGIANSSIIKTGVDVLTGLITVINKLTSILPGASNGLAKLGIAIAGFKGGSLLVKSVLPNLLKTFKGGGAEASQGFWTGFKDNLKNNIDSNKNKDGFINKFKGHFINQFKQDYGSFDDLKAQYGDLKVQYDETYAEAMNAFQSGDMLRFNELNGQLDELNAKIDKVPSKIKALATTLSGVAVASTAAGAAFLGVSKILQKVGADDEVVELFQTLGTILMTFGTILPILSAAFKATGKDIALSGLVAQLGWGWIGLIIGIIAAVTAAGIAWVKYNQSLSNTAQLEKANDKLKDLQDEASEASNKLNELLDAEHNYNELQDGLDKLTVGTNEWKNALIEANQEVLNLLETFPELAKYINSDTNGRLTIDSEGLDLLVEQQQQNVLDKQTAVVLQRGVISNLSNEILEEEIWRSNADGSAKWSDDVQRNNLEKEQTILKNNVSKDAAVKTALSTYGIDSEINDILAEQVIDLTKFEERALKENWGDLSANADMELRQFAEDRNIEVSNLQSKEDLTKFYQALGGTEDTSDMSVRELRATIGYFAELNKQFSNASKITENYNKVSPEAQAAIKALGDGSDLTAQDLRELDIEGTLEDGLTEAAKLFGIGVDEFVQQFGFENAQAARDNYDNINSNYNQTVADMITKAMVNTSKIGERGSEGNQKLVTSANQISQYASIKQLDNYLSAYEQMFGKFGEKTTNAFFDSFNTALDSEDDEVKQKILDLMSGVDFSDFDSLEEFKKEIKEIDGISKDNGLTEVITNFEDLNNITREVDLSKLINGFKDLLDLADDIEGKDELAGEGLSQEEYDAIIDQFPDMVDSFVFDGQEWQYVDGTMQQLAFELRENTTAIMGNTAELLEQQIQEKQKIIDKAENANLSEEFMTGALDENNFKEIKDGLSDMFGSAFISGLSNSEVIEKYKEFVNAINTIGTDQATLDQYKTQTSSAVAYQNLMNTNASNLSTTSDISLNLDEAALDNYNKLLDKQISRIDVMQDEIDYATEGYKKLGYSEESATRAAKELIIQNDKLEDKIDNVRKVIGDELDTLNSFSKDSKEVTASYQKIALAASELFGQNISKEFIRDNLDVFKDFEAGSTTAYQKICDKLNEQTFETWRDIYGSIEGHASNIENVISALDNLQFDIYGNADCTDAINEMIKMGWTADQVANQLNNVAGLTLNFQPGDLQEYINALNNINSDSPVRQAVGAAQLARIRTLGGLTVSKGGRNFNPSGTGNYAPSGGSGGGGGGGGSDKENKWENPYDELYNITEQINENLRKREKLEREYDRILKNRDASTKEIIQNSLDEIANLQREKDLQQQILDGRRRQINNLGNKTYTDSEGNESTFSALGVTRYAKYDFNKNVIEIDWNAIDQVEDEDTGKAIEDYISQLEELQDQFEEAEDRLDEIKDEISEIKERNKDNYLELEERIYDALVERQQKIIDEFSDLSDTIENSTGRIFDSIEKSIEDERQARENAETEQNISDMESRLAYLQRDTSGGNALEILQLQKNLEEARQDYSDNLIDQALQQMQDDADLAAQQRADQIEIMQAQLDWQKESGYFWDQVYELIHNSIDNEGTLAHNEDLVKLLQETDAFTGMSYFGQANWVEEMVHDWIEAQEGLNNWRMQKAEEAGSLTLNNGTELTYNNDKQTWSDSKGNTYSNVHWDEKSEQYIGTNNNDAPKPAQTPTTTTKTTTTSSSAKPTLTTDIAQGIATAICLLGSPYQGGWGNWPDRETNLNNKFGAGAYNKVQSYVDAIANSGWANIYGKDPSKYTISKFKTGGLADFTGPAWLDGTKSKPEMVLNSKDTENFIQLKDILASILSGSKVSEKPEKGGDNYFDINIQADIDSDYDVDQLAARIKKQIYDDSSYRNVNAINFIR